MEVQAEKARVLGKQTVDMVWKVDYHAKHKPGVPTICGALGCFPPGLFFLPFLRIKEMYMLYLDESGNVSDASQRHYVCAGISVFERQSHWIGEDVNKIAMRFSPDDPESVEFHGSPMRSGRGQWRVIDKEERLTAIEDCLKIVLRSHERGHARLFGSVISKTALHDRDPVEYVFEQVSSRFDLFLRRRYLKNDPQRGIIIFDKTINETRIQALARDFKTIGHSWGKTTNYAEVPVFLDSRASRLIQLADLVAFSMYRHYEHGDSRFYDIIANCFDSDGGTKHGLHELL